MFSASRGRLRRKVTTFGVDRLQAALCFEANDLVKEIGQTCSRSATVRLARDLE
jgi:hypothetical protein